MKALIDPGLIAIVRLVKEAGRDGISATTLKLYLPSHVERLTGIPRKHSPHWSVKRIKEVLEETDDDGASGRMFEMAKCRRYRINTGV